MTTPRPSPRRRKIVTSALLTVCLVLAIGGLLMGSERLDPSEVLRGLLPGADPRLRLVVWQWRAPRMAGALCFGAALALSGALFQQLTRNALGSPDVVGFDTGAFTGVILTLMLGYDGTLARSLGALCGGLATAVLVARRSAGLGMTRLIIVGIACSAALGSANTMFVLHADLDVAFQVAAWNVGSVSEVRWQQLAVALVVLVPVSLCTPLCQRWLRQLALGDDFARASGVRVELAKAITVLVGVTLSAGVTAIAGPIAFVALAAPQIAARLMREGPPPLGASALVGAVLLTSADLLAGHALPDVTLPAGAVTIWMGGAYLLWLLLRERRRG